MDRYYFLTHGLLGPFGFFRKFLKIKLNPGQKDFKLRESLLAEIEGILRPQFELLLSKFNLNLKKMEINQLSQAYVHLFIDWFPIGFLEGLPYNLEQVRHNLNMNKVVGTVGHSMTSHLGYLLSTLTRLAGKTVVGVQHGGHVGYIEDNSAHGYSEYELYDKMITWGWTRIDDHLPHCETIPLPSPKLSEQPFKSDYLKNVKSKSTDMRDILFLSNQFHRFPNASTCGQSRVDFIDEISNSQEGLMRAIKDAGLTISHKPFNMKFVDLYPEHFHRLEVAGGSTSYRLLESTHKGLTVKLIKTCRIVLYDQIGTGTLECFTSEVPCMVYWKRIYSRETPWAKDLISALEQYGVIHSDAGSLAKEIKAYLADPGKWMNNSGRKQAIQNFCEIFALTSNDWPKLWRDYLSSLR
jgi:putative transferase (TIGR04331 family)